MSAVVDKEMLEEIKALLSQQKSEILEETVGLLSQQKSEILGEVATCIKASEEQTHRNMMVLFENDINPRFQYLAEGHESLMKKMISHERIDAIEDDVDVLKMAVRHVNKDISELKRAQ